MLGKEMSAIMDERRQAAIEWLGDKWVLAPARRVQKLKASEVQDIHKADVAATFARVRKQMAKGTE